VEEEVQMNLLIAIIVVVTIKTITAYKVLLLAEIKEVKEYQGYRDQEEVEEVLKLKTQLFIILKQLCLIIIIILGSHWYYYYQLATHWISFLASCVIPWVLSISLLFLLSIHFPIQQLLRMVLSLPKGLGFAIISRCRVSAVASSWASSVALESRSFF